MKKLILIFSLMFSLTVQAATQDEINMFTRELTKGYAGAFSTLSATGAVSGTGFSNYMTAGLVSGQPGAFSTLSATGTTSLSGVVNINTNYAVIGLPTSPGFYFGNNVSAGNEGDIIYSTVGTSPGLFISSWSGSVYTVIAKITNALGLSLYAGAFNGAGTGLTGTAAGLSIGGNAGTATNLSGGTSAPTTENASTSYSLNGKLLNTAASPSLGGGGTCGVGATVSGSTASFTVYTGTGSGNTQCNINMPSGATSGWICFAQPPLPAANTATIFQSLTATTANVVNITVSTGALVAWPSGYTFHVGCISSY